MKLSSILGVAFVLGSISAGICYYATDHAGGRSVPQIARHGDVIRLLPEGQVGYYSGKIRWQNDAASPVTLIGCQTSCGCVVAKAPLGAYSIGSGCDIPVTLKMPEHATVACKKIILELEEAGIRRKQLFTVCAYELPPEGISVPSSIRIDPALHRPRTARLEVQGSKSLLESLSYEKMTGVKIKSESLSAVSVDGTQIPDLWQATFSFSFVDQEPPPRLPYRFRGGQGETKVVSFDSFACVCSPSAFVISGASSETLSLDIIHRDAIRISLGDLEEFMDFTARSSSTEKGLNHTRVDLRMPTMQTLSKMTQGDVIVFSEKEGTVLKKIPIYYFSS